MYNEEDNENVPMNSDDLTEKYFHSTLIIIFFFYCCTRLIKGEWKSLI